ncbi:hypothetical protein D3C71_681810 [compost metagenome]
MNRLTDQNLLQFIFTVMLFVLGSAAFGQLVANNPGSVKLSKNRDELLTRNKLAFIHPFLFTIFTVPKKSSHVFDFRYRNNRFTA